MTVLVVDDSEAVASIITRIATQSGWHGIHAANVADVPEILKTTKVDLVMLDYIMPGKNGLELARELRAAGWASLPIILFSGMAELINKADAAAVGITHVLQKPLGIAELRCLMNEAKDQLEGAPL